jgi:hypothetical protein
MTGFCCLRNCRRLNILRCLQAASYNNRYITMVDFGALSSSPFGSIVVRNLVEVGSYFSSVMYQLVTADRSVFADRTNPLLDSIMLQFLRYGNGHETLQTSMNLGFDITMRSRDAIAKQQTATFAAMVVVLIVAGLGVFLPILKNIDRDSDAIMLQFVHLPLPVRSDLCDQANKRVTLLRRDFGDDGEADSDESDDDASGRYEGQQNDGSHVIDMQPRLLNSDDENVVRFHPSLPTSKQPGAALSAHRRRKLAPTYKKNGWAFVRLALRFLFPLLLLLLFFIVLYAQFMTTLGSVFTLTAISAAANRRGQCARQSLIELRKLQYLTSDRAYIRNVFWSAMQAVDCVTLHNRLLAFGDKTGISGSYATYVTPVESGRSSAVSAATSHLVHRAAFENACTVLQENGNNVDLADCESFVGGVMLEGIVAVSEVGASNLTNA